MREEQKNDKAVNHEADSTPESPQPYPEQTASNELDEVRIEELRELERRIGYTFNDIRLLDLSLTHKSFLGGNGEHSECNERMEFLGGTVLELIISSFLKPLTGEDTTPARTSFGPGPGSWLLILARLSKRSCSITRSA